MKKIISLLLMMLVLVFAGCSNIDDNTVITTPKPTIASSTTGTTVPTTVPTKPTTKAPTIHDHPEPGKNEDDLEYTPSDIPQEYWAVLNNQQEIYFDYPITVQEGYDISSKKTAYLDVIQLRGDVDELAASKCSYSVMDMDGDGNSELLILNHSVLILSHKDGIVYGWNGLGAVDIYKDGTYSWGKQAGANYGRSRIVYVGFGIWTSVEMWRVDRYLLDEPEYYLGNQLVTKETFDRYQDANNTDDIEWKALSRYPLYSRDEKYPPLN